MSQTPHYVAPDPDAPDWIDFLHWMVDHGAASGTLIVRIVANPHRYGDCYYLYRQAGGINR